MQDYKRLTDVEHVLTRPGIYIGSVFNATREAFVMDNGKMTLREVEYNPALVKMFDEILSNSADESVRSGSVENIWVTVDNETISVKDDGGIPVKIHDEYGIYIPELLFGELRSGSNFNDDERTTAGMNGLGSVLTNIFSKEFTVVTADKKKMFTQVYRNNMSERDEPIIKGSRSHGTTITFKPDLERLACTLDSDNIAMIERRCYDIAGTYPTLNVYFNGKLLELNSFVDYANMFSDGAKIHDTNGKWEVVVSSTTNDNFNQVSFVNGIDTYEGGTHVNFVTNQIVNEIRTHIETKHKVNVKPAIIKNNLFVMIKATINAPAFNSQTKECLINEPSSFENPIQISKGAIARIIKSDIIQRVLDWAEAEQDRLAKAELRKLNKTTQKASMRHILKFDDASSKERNKCALYLAEGDSAAKPILTARGSNPYIGVFALKGKILNVRKASKAAIMANEEIKNLMTILGLQLGVKANRHELNFGSIVIASDPDVDGSHIAALIVNLFATLWPELLDNGFVTKLTTPVVEAKVGKVNHEFFTEEAYAEWAKTAPKHTYKYHKGLGGFSDMSRFVLRDEYKSAFILEEGDAETIDMIFNGDRADDRKVWLQ